MAGEEVCYFVLPVALIHMSAAANLLTLTQGLLLCKENFFRIQDFQSNEAFVWWKSMLKPMQTSGLLIRGKNGIYFRTG